MEKKAMTRKKNPQPEDNQAVVKYEPNDQERQAERALVEATRADVPAPRFKLVNGNLVIDHPDPDMGAILLMRSLATTSLDFTNGIVNQIANALTVGRETEADKLNFALAFIASIKPKDELETILAAQMAAVHAATMTQARRLANAETIPQQDSNERALNKLARTFTTQMDALKRYRTGGEQKVTVHHVTVNEGGQAIVGTVERSGDRGEG